MNVRRHPVWMLMAIAAMLMAMATGYDYRKYQRVKAVEKRSR